ncbi:MAG: hypothetical protein H0U13_12480 [Gemmatimonadaceae bacterium]|nr:hypothetical protein [Gemmatimonadaceae bacterium]
MTMTSEQRLTFATQICLAMWFKTGNPAPFGMMFCLDGPQGYDKALYLDGHDFPAWTIYALREDSE